MKTKLHFLTKWMVAMLLCTVSLSAFADATNNSVSKSNIDAGAITSDDEEDPLVGAFITLTGCEELNGEYVYAGLENSKNTFVDTLEIGVVKVVYNSGWKIMLDSDSLLYSNETYGSYVPENFWIAEASLSDTIAFTPSADLTSNYFEGNTLDVKGDKYAGNYKYFTTVGIYPAYKLEGEETQSVVYKNDTAWVIVSGPASDSVFTDFNIESYSLKEFGKYVPTNNWTNFVGEDFSPEFSGYYSSKFVAIGETITLAGTDFDTELLYNGDNSTHSFTATVGDVEVTIAKVNYEWSILYDDSVYFTFGGYVSGGLVPDFAWQDANGVYSALTVSGVMTGSDYDGDIAEVTGLSSFTMEFVYAGVINDRISFTYGVKVLKCVDNVWGIYADADATTPLAFSSITTPFLIPQNGWNNDVAVSNNDVSEFVFDADILTVYNTESDVDGEYAFDSIDTKGYPVYSNVVGDDTYYVAYVDYDWHLLVGDSALYYCPNSISIGDNSVIPQNSWVSLSDDSSFVYFEGVYTADVYTGEEITVGDKLLTYSGMINNRYSFSGADNMALQHNGTAWEILSDDVVIYTNDFVSEDIPSNMWVAVDGGDDILLDGDETTFYYDEVVFSGLSIDVANGAYTVEKNSAYSPTFSKQITTGEYAGGEVYFKLSTRGTSVILSAPDTTIVLCANANSPRNSFNKKVAPQNCWTVGGVYDTAIVASGKYSTEHINAVIVFGASENPEMFSYSDGEYSGEINSDDVELKIVENGDSSFWQLATSVDTLVEVIAVNYNLDGTLLPQNKWLVGGVEDTLFTVTGDSTFFVKEVPASLVDANVVEFAIYPNPAQSLVNIDVTAAGSLEVYSLSGATVMSSFLQEGHNTVSISSLDKGIYLLITNIDGKREVSRLIKE